MPKAHMLAVMVALVAAAAGRSAMCAERAGDQGASTPQQILRSSTDREALTREASALARSGDAKDLAQLGQLLRDAAFLARLDDLNGLQTRYVSQIIAALAERPTPEVVELSARLAEDPVFASDGDRKSLVLELLAAVKPMSERTAAVFQRSNEEGYFAFNARLLAENRSPHALALFESMMLDQEVPAESRVECLHVSVLPGRTDPDILRTADRILSRNPERAVVNGVVESVFAFRQEWFGIESGISQPPAWQTASNDALRSAVTLADKALGRRDLTAALRATVSQARRTIAQVLSARGK